MVSSPLRNRTVWPSVLTGYTVRPLAQSASRAFSYGITKDFLSSCDNSQTARGKIPDTPLKRPSSDSSPQKTLSMMPSLFKVSVATKIPIAIARSKLEPSFLRSAGARFTVILFVGNGRPLLSIAARTRSALSLQAVSGSPTILNLGSPLEISTSTSTG